jgi:hypothetical protein
MTRRQVYLDISAMSGGGGRRSDGSETPYFDIDVMVDLLANHKMNLVLDPYSGVSRWAIQTALYNAFGGDGKKEPLPYTIEKLRSIATTMDYIPPIQIHSAIVVGKHDNCHRPHPGGD